MTLAQKRGLAIGLTIVETADLAVIGTGSALGLPSTWLVYLSLAAGVIGVLLAFLPRVQTGTLGMDGPAAVTVSNVDEVAQALAPVVAAHASPGAAVAINVVQAVVRAELQRFFPEKDPAAPPALVTQTGTPLPPAAPSAAPVAPSS